MRGAAACAGACAGARAGARARAGAGAPAAAAACARAGAGAARARARAPAAAGAGAGARAGAAGAGDRAGARAGAGAGAGAAAGAGAGAGGTRTANPSRARSAWKAYLRCDMAGPSSKQGRRNAKMVQGGARMVQLLLLSPRPGLEKKHTHRPRGSRALHARMGTQGFASPAGRGAGTRATLQGATASGDGEGRQLC